MGLDMYLEGDLYLSCFGKEKVTRSKIAKMATDHPFLVGKEVNSVTFDIAYWRKANAIHRWFVEQVQDGEDDCRRYLVSRNQLAELVDICKRVLADRSLAMELLPPAEGFFFGETDLGEWYFETLEGTVKMLEPLLDPETSLDFYYRSSW